MEKMEAIGTPASQSQIIQRMQSMATAAANGAPAPAMSIEGNNLPPVSFGQALDNAVNHVDDLQQNANARQMAIDMGQSDDLTGAMLESQKAGVSFSALVQVRNKLASALDEVLNIAL